MFILFIFLFYIIVYFIICISLFYIIAFRAFCFFVFFFLSNLRESNWTNYIIFWFYIKIMFIAFRACWHSCGFIFSTTITIALGNFLDHELCYIVIDVLSYKAAANEREEPKLLRFIIDNNDRDRTPHLSRFIDVSLGGETRDREGRDGLFAARESSKRNDELTIAKITIVIRDDNDIIFLSCF